MSQKQRMIEPFQSWNPDIIINRQGLYSNYDSEVQEIYKKRQNRRKDRKLS